ncbi:hypothetical protein QSH57_013201 [Fusarium oxysporum f. sp. vasinfectum]|nr:hypothetical protein QSH57_013201 [Fusarium oxysporum f. sp. vasinfectum]
MEARSTTNTLQHETSEIARIAHPSIFPDNSGLDASPTSMHAEAAISLSEPFDSLPNVQIGNDTLLWGDRFWLNMDSLCHFAPDLEAEDIPGSGVVGLDQPGTHGQSNIQAQPESSERTYLELYFQIINPQWPLFV